MINLQNLRKSYGSKDLYAGLNLRIDAGDRIGMIGSNGTGKTTLARIITGTETYDEGTLTRTKSWKIGYLAQEVERVKDQILHDFVEGGRPELVEARLELERFEELIQSNHDEKTQMGYADALSNFEEAGGYVVEAEVDRILHGLGFNSGQSKKYIKTFSGGWIMRAALARLLFQRPDLLILDEPTNHLDLPALTWLEGFLKEWKGAYLVISHDRTFLNTMVDKIIELEHSELILYYGNYDIYVEQKEQRVEILEATLKNQEQKIAQVERFIEKNRAQKSKARQAGSRKKMLQLLESQLVDIPRRQKKIKFKFPQPERSGTPSIILQDIYKSYGENIVYQGMDFQISRGEKIALVGPNGAGKSTLLKIAADVLDFEKGDRVLGHNVTTHYFAQHQLESLDGKKTPLMEMSELPGWDKISWLRGLLGALLLGEKEIETNIEDLSGGEKAKLAIAKMLIKPANLILMDEPTNHLDPLAREVLEEALTDYSGTLIFISHDRTFINNIASKVVEVEDGKLETFLGNYDDYMRKSLVEPEEEAKTDDMVEYLASVRKKKIGKKGKQHKSVKGDEKERKRLEAERRSERKKVTNKAQSKVKQVEEQITAAESKLAAIHETYSRPDNSPGKLAELGRNSRALSEDLKKLYARWEEASTELEEIEKQLSEDQ